MDEPDFEIVAEPMKSARPHVVLLGAGASRAAFPNGDGSGKKLPLLNELAEVVGCGPEWAKLTAAARPPEGTFEEQFSWCKSHGGFHPELAAIEEKIKDYFASLRLPDAPTIYDHLVLGLRPRDVIATFNWDPLLLQAYRRNRGVAPLPDLRFLHGCVAFATCAEHDVLGVDGDGCPLCGARLQRGPLIFPVKDKDYAAHSAIHRDWQIVTARLKVAFHFTIFGYSGPATDASARKLLLEGWQATPFREASHVEIIDVADEDLLRQRWAEFIPYQHDLIHRDFFGSSVARFPRRTAEWKYRASLYGMPSKDVGPFEASALPELQTRYRTLAEHEAVIRNEK